MIKKSMFFTFAALFFAAAVLVSCQKEDSIGFEDAAILKVAGENCVACVTASSLTHDNTAQTVALTPSGNQMQATFSHTTTELKVIISRTSGNFTKLVGTIKHNGVTILSIDDNSAARTTVTYTVALPGSAMKCDDILLDLTAINGVGATNAGSASYKLRSLCTQTSIDVDPGLEVCVDDEVTVTGSVLASGAAVAGGSLTIWEKIGETWVNSTENPLIYEAEAGSRTFKAVYDGSSSNWYNSSESAPVDVVAVSCDCDESFGYVDNGDGTYTFTFVPAADLTGASLVFTFPQSALNGDPLPGWTYNGQTMQTTMDLEACETYEWTVSLSCKDLNNPQNKWTDFKVNNESLKEKYELSNIKCD